MEMIQLEGKILPSHLTASRSRGSRPQAAVGGEPELQEVAKEAPVTTLVERDTKPSRRAREASEEKVGRSNRMFVFMGVGSSEETRELPGPLVSLGSPWAKLQKSRRKKDVLFVCLFLFLFSFFSSVLFFGGEGIDNKSRRNVGFK